MRVNNYLFGEENLFNKWYSKVKDAYTNYQTKKLERVQEEISLNNDWYVTVKNSGGGRILEGDIIGIFAGANEMEKTLRERRKLKRQESKLLKKLNKND